MDSHTDRETGEIDLRESGGKTESKTTASSHSAGATSYRLQKTGALCPLRGGRGRLPTTHTGRRVRLSHIPVSENRPCQKRKERQKKAYRLQMTLRIGLPVEPVGDPGRAPKCYAQVTKSPNDHQGADI